MASLGRLLAVVRKEVREILRDPITLGIAIALPILLMFLFTYAITLDVREIRVAVLDEDGSPESREYVAAFCRSSSSIFRRARALTWSHGTRPSA